MTVAIDTSSSGHYVGDCRDLLKQLPDACAQTCITSPPYWGLRDYGVAGQLGLESTPFEYVANMVEVFRGVRRALRDDGTLWLNLGDSYASGPSGGITSSGLAGSQSSQSAFRAATKHKHVPDGLKPKDLVGIPWMVAFALREDGWYLRSDIIWHKPNPMPESVTDRPTKAHEYVFLLSKSERYYFDAEAIKEPSADIEGSEARYKSAFGGDKSRAPVGESGIDTRTRPLGMREFDGKRNKRTVWTVASHPYPGSHFATMPPALAEPCVLAGSRIGDIVLDPFFGSGTTGMVAEKHGRKWIGFDINPEYAELAKERTAQRSLVLGGEP